MAYGVGVPFNGPISGVNTGQIGPLGTQWVPQQGFKGADVQRTPVQKALKPCTPLVQQKIALGGGFHSFSDHVHAQAVPQVHQGAGDGGGPRVQWAVTNEGAVDLELVQGQTLQVAQGRVPGTEVVNGKPHAQIVQRLHFGGHVVNILNQGAFGQFRFEAVGRGAS